MKQHGNKFFVHPSTPPPHVPRDESKGQKSTFSEHGHIAYQIKGHHECNMVATCLLAKPFLTLGMRSIGQNSTFSGNGHVAYQIKWNHEMQQHGSKYFLPAGPLTLGVKINYFQNVVLLHIKLKGITNAAAW